jgi:hypothetical protein
MKFDKSTAPFGTLYLYYSANAYCGSQLMVTRKKVTMKAGSGNGSNNECTKNAGWLPNGTYSNIRYERDHQTNSKVVKGSVWYLGDKLCQGGSTKRTELFIHSQGANGGAWAEANYKSEGCIKINQEDRTYLAGLYNRPIYGMAGTDLHVTS